MKAFIYAEKQGEGVHPSGWGWCVNDLASKKIHHLKAGGNDEAGRQAAVAEAAKLLGIDEKDIAVHE